MNFTAGKSKVTLFLAAVLVLASTPQASLSQTNSNVSNVTLTATLLESLTIAAAPSAVTFNLVSGGVANGSAPVVVTTTWVLLATRTTVRLYGYFASSAVALTDGVSHDLASSLVFGQVTTGLPTTFTAFTQTGPFGGAGASLQLFSQSITLLNLSGTRTDTLSLRIDLTSAPQTPAGVYTGTLQIQAQAL